MKTPTRISGAIAAASLALAAAGCADAPTTTPAATSATAAAAPSAASASILATSSALGDEGARLSAAVENAEQRARLQSALTRLSTAMRDGDVNAARRALVAARDGLRYLENDVDRDALRLSLDSVDEQLNGDAR